MTVKIEQLSNKLSWSYNSEGASIVMQLADGRWEWEYNIDPFPCYTHSLELVRQFMNVATDAFPTGVDTNVFIMPFESKARWNGFCNADHNWDKPYDEEKDVERPFTHRIVMAGKRTPIHPAMTRFVTVHEYGHAVVKWIANRMGYKDNHKFYKEVYVKLRPNDDFGWGYGAQEWHAFPGEVAADDFRILLCNVESEHWPHYGFNYPTKVTGLKEWWEEAREKFAAK